jgi:DNA-binding CsgD family transcriptional regulator
MTSTEPEAVLARVHAGERVRVLPTVTARLAVFGSDAAVLPEVWASPTSPPLLVRQPSLVAVCTAWFDQLWAGAVSVHGYADGVDNRTRDQLVHLLAQGAKDEQIARLLGVSLRTVRRRIASVLLELGAESRFQAGVESVRAGWL